MTGPPRNTTASARSSSTPAPSRSSPTRSGRTPTSPGRTPPTSRVSRTAPSSAPRRRRRRARTTTGARRMRCAAQMSQLFEGRDEGAHDVRRAVLDGPARLGQVAHRRSAHRLALRRRLDADHDPDGPGRARRAGRRRRVRPMRPLGRRSAGRGRKGLALADERRDQVHRPLPGVARDLVVRLGLRRQRSAWARSAWRSGSPRSWPATRAGWPSTC